MQEPEQILNLKSQILNSLRPRTASTFYPMLSLGDRYAAILPVEIRERELLSIPREWDELQLQAHWFAGDFGRDFTTTAGQPLRIVQFGVWNHEAGPDFSHAATSASMRSESCCHTSDGSVRARLSAAWAMRVDG